MSSKCKSCLKAEIFHILNQERLIKYIFQLRLSFLRPNQEPYSLENRSLTFANRQLYELLYLSCVIYDDRPGNKKTYQYELIRQTPAHKSCFCSKFNFLRLRWRACVGGIEKMPQTVKTASNIFFVDSLCIIGGYLTNHVCLFCYFDSCVWRPI